MKDEAGRGDTAAAGGEGARGDAEIAFASALAANRAAANAVHQTGHAHEYYQTSLLSALMRGVYDGDVTVAALLRHGDFGLGTFNALDGEMVVIDGVAYRLSSDGTASVADAKALTPYAAVIPFEPDLQERIDGPCGKDAFEARLDGLARSRNLFYAIRVEARFRHVRVRGVTRQTPPYRPLREAVADQRVNDFRDLEGSLVGFRCPDYAIGIGVPGYHLHFVSADRTVGGHVLDYTLASGTLLLDHTASIHLELPESEAFAEADLASAGDAAAVAEVEGEGGPKPAD